LTSKVAVIGLGYVGLPLSVAAANSGFKVVGIDINQTQVTNINQGLSPIVDVSNEEISKLVKNGQFIATSEFSEIIGAEVVLLCVPTPLSTNHKPDISSLEMAAKSISPYIGKNMLVILESTVEPGTTRNILSPLLTKGSKLKQDDFLVAFSPERIDPANKVWTVKNTPKLVSGLTEDACNKAINFYEKFIQHLVKCDSVEIAETSKLLENSFRLINISFINEISMFCNKLGIDVNAVIAAAESKPYGFMPFYPSVGVGGHCIPVDPLYLANKAREIGAPTKLIDLASKLNRELPDYFVNRAVEKIGNLKAKKVLILGVSYKPNTADVRETPVQSLIESLRKKGADVSWNDELVKEWNGEKSVAITSNFDLAILATPHEYFSFKELGNVPILNTRGSI
jgi:UDP-N-acetyl-D-glucosamine dehydrogenase